MWINLPLLTASEAMPGYGNQARRRLSLARAAAGSLWLGLCLWLAGLAPANADWHGKLSVLSDYVYRGYSKSGGEPVLQGQAHYQDVSGWFAGAALSQTKFAWYDHTSLEAKPFIGFSWPMTSDWQAELSAYGYLYDGKVFGKTADFAEFSAAWHYQDWLSGKIIIAPDTYQRGASLDYELNYRRDLTDTVQLSAGFGFYQAKKLLGEDYCYWNLGVSWYLVKHLVLDVRYVDVQLDGRYPGSWQYRAFRPRLISDHLLLSLSLGF